MSGSSDGAGTAKKCQLESCTALLLKVLYSLKCLFFMYYLCEKYYEHITVQYYTAGCVSWVPKITFWTYGQIGFTNTFSEWRAFLVVQLV